MRKRAQRNIPHVQINLALLMALFASLTLAGCGGGGGGGTPTPTPTTPTSSATLATLTGTVTDTTAAATPIAGASVQIPGTNLAATSGADGKFVIINVPVGTVRVAVVNPTGYSGYVFYQGKEYDTQMCPLTVTTVASGSGTNKISSPLPAAIQLYPTSVGPPPPPATGANGCPL